MRNLLYPLTLLLLVVACNNGQQLKSFNNVITGEDSLNIELSQSDTITNYALTSPKIPASHSLIRYPLIPLSRTSFVPTGVTGANHPFAPTAPTGTTAPNPPLPLQPLLALLPLHPSIPHLIIFCIFMPTNSIFCFTFLTIWFIMGISADDEREFFFVSKRGIRQKSTLMIT